MTPKEYLLQARVLDQQITARIAERDRIMDQVTAARAPSLTGMPRGGQHDWTDAVARAADLTATIDAELAELCRLKAEIAAAIKAVPEPVYRTLLELRYRSGFTWEQIAEAMGYDVRHVYRLHGEALLRVHVPGSAGKLRESE